MNLRDLNHRLQSLSDVIVAFSANYFVWHYRYWQITDCFCWLYSLGHSPCPYDASELMNPKKRSLLPHNQPQRNIIRQHRWRIDYWVECSHSMMLLSDLVSLVASDLHQPLTMVVPWLSFLLIVL